jgi:hypothetical protein
LAIVPTYLQMAVNTNWQKTMIFRAESKTAGDSDGIDITNEEVNIHLSFYCFIM